MIKRLARTAPVHASCEIPVYVQHANKPNRAVRVGVAPDSWTPHNVGMRFGYDDQTLIQGKVRKMAGVRQWRLVIAAELPEPVHHTVQADETPAAAPLASVVHGGRRVLDAFSLSLADDEVWVDPSGIVVYSSPVHHFNGTTERNLITVATVDDGDFDDLTRRGLDPTEHSGHDLFLRPRDARRLAAALLKAADAMEAA